VKGLVVNSSVQVLDEDIALASLSESRITLGPHDTAGTALDESVVQLLESFLAIGGGVVVDIGVSKGAASHGITADTDRGDRSNLGEELEKHGLSDGGIEFADVERSRGLRVGSSRAWGWSSGVRILGADVGDIGVEGSCTVCIAAVQGGLVEVGGQLVDSGGSGSSRHLEYANGVVSLGNNVVNGRVNGGWFQSRRFVGGE